MSDQNKRFYFLLILLLFNNSLIFAGDNPCDATLLDVNSNGELSFDNSGNSESGIEAPPYGNYFGPDTWLRFTMPYSGELPMIIIPGTMVNPGIAIYSGDCTDLKLIYNVIDSNCDLNNGPGILFDELNEGEDYYIRVWAETGVPNGDFSISFDLIYEELEFLLYDDAYATGDDCYVLSDLGYFENGCAWLENTIDFSQSFTHVMMANFGDLQYDPVGGDLGGDGICLVYQSNGVDYCGAAGQGIGAEGMPNSVIIEFDTWQNIWLNDPVLDHCALNLNGVMDHALSIDGPIDLGDIEDGIFHEITFNWEPVTNSYSIEFDGVVQMSGNYDFINNVFGGVTDVWWGYTSATGAAINKHIICPVIPDPIFVGTQEYQEVVICEGEQYLGHNDSGFYIEYLPSANNCQHQINLLLEVVPTPEVYEFDTLICSDDFYYFNGDTYSMAGIYTSDVLTADLCDSTVIMNLSVLELELEISVVDTLNCYNSTVVIIPTITSNYNYTNFVYQWIGPSSIGLDSLFEVDSPGIYELTVYLDIEGVTCSITDSVIVLLDTLSPIINELTDSYLHCGENSSFVYEIDSSSKDVIYQWTFEDVIFSDSIIVEISEPGMYFIEVINLNTGCSNRDSVAIVTVGEPPSLVVKNDTLTCDKTSIELQAVSADVVDYIWFYESDTINDVPSPTIDEPGTYEVHVMNSDGCIHIESLEVYLDDTYPIIQYENDTIPCNTSQIDVNAILKEENAIYSWNGPDGFFSDEIDIVVNQEGSYKVTVTNIKNGCISFDSIDIVDLGESPMLEVFPKLLNCYTPSYFIESIINDTQVTYIWLLDGQDFSTEPNPVIDLGGDYKVSVLSAFGCETVYEFHVADDFSIPQVTIDTPEVITCSNTEVVLNASFLDSITYHWVGPGSFNSIETKPIVNLEGKYNLTIQDTTNGCVSSYEVKVETEGSIPSFSLEGDDLDCTHDSVLVSLNTNEVYKYIEWSGPSGFVSEELSVYVNIAGEYTVEVVNEYGCKKSQLITIMDTTAMPELDLLLKDTIYYTLGEEIQIYTDVVRDVEHLSSVLWFPDTLLSCSDCLEPWFLSDEEVDIDYTLTVTNSQGCQDKINVFFRFIEEVEPLKIIAPNIIIVQGSDDESNNRFTLYGSPIELIDRIQRLAVYDRWGNQMFLKNSFPINDISYGWDGSMKGVSVAPGVYVFEGKVLLLSGEVVNILGDLTVIK